MLTGYNTNIPYNGSIYHVQTEDRGPKNPIIITLLYHKGAILASKKLSYAQFLNDENWRQRIEVMMKKQHQNMISELKAGKYTGEEIDKVDEEASFSNEKAERLDDILIDFIISRER